MQLNLVITVHRIGFVLLEYSLKEYALNYRKCMVSEPSVCRRIIFVGSARYPIDTLVHRDSCYYGIVGSNTVSDGHGARSSLQRFFKV